MTTRREFANLLGGGALAAAMVAGVQPAHAQSAANENTFQKIMRTKRLRVGGVASGAPWTIKNQTTGQWSGHFHAIAAALAADMEVELEMIETTWGNAILDLQANKIDVMFGMNPTPKRALAVDFTVPVYNSALVVIAKPGFTPATWDDLNRPEIRISTDMGGAHDQVATRLCPKARMLRFKSLDEATMALRGGRADAQSIFWMGGLRAVKKDPKLGSVVVPQPMFGSTSNAAVRRETDKTLRDFLNTWIVYSQGLGLIREAVFSSLELVGVQMEDIPPGISL